MLIITAVINTQNGIFQMLWIKHLILPNIWIIHCEPYFVLWIISFFPSSISPCFVSMKHYLISIWGWWSMYAMLVGITTYPCHLRIHVILSRISCEFNYNFISVGFQDMFILSGWIIRGLILLCTSVPQTLSFSCFW